MVPYYPVNYEKNGKLFASYKELSEKEEHVIFGGRLGNYQYYDMDKVVEAALLKLEELGVCKRWASDSNLGQTGYCAGNVSELLRKNTKNDMITECE